jgi:hypothetical protein
VLKGCELSEGFFRDTVYPAIVRSRPDLLDFMSAGFLGDGSEVLGYDDEISHDHNFSPRVLLFLPDDLFAAVGPHLCEELVAAMPACYADFDLAWTEYRKALEVLPLSGFFCRALDMDHLPSNELEWLRCDEQKLRELTSGSVFYDPNGHLAALRGRLSYYPNGVRLYLLYQTFTRLSETAGVERALQRGEWLTVRLYASYFAYFAIKAAHLLVRRYCPYQKWMARSLRELGQAGFQMHDWILALLSASTPEAVREGFLQILSELGTQVADDLGVPRSQLRQPGGLVLLGYDWDAVLRPLADRIPEALCDLLPLVSLPSYLGQIFDYTGYGGTYEELLAANLALYRGPQAVAGG